MSRQESGLGLEERAEHEGASGEPESSELQANPRFHLRRRRRRKGSSLRVDARTKQEKSRQSARECRARKKLRYQYLEELVTLQEAAVHKLKEELQQAQEECKRLDDETAATPNSKESQKQ